MSSKTRPPANKTAKKSNPRDATSSGPVKDSDRGHILQWRPKPKPALRTGRHIAIDKDFAFELNDDFNPNSITAKIFAAERRPLPAKQARSLPYWDSSIDNS